MNRLLVVACCACVGFLLPSVVCEAVNCTKVSQGCFTWLNGDESPYPGYCCFSGGVDVTGRAPISGGHEKRDTIPSTGSCSDLWEVNFGTCDNIICFNCCGGATYSKNCARTP